MIVEAKDDGLGSRRIGCEVVALKPFLAQQEVA